MKTTQTFGSITIEMNENGHYLATGYYGFTAVIKKGMSADQIEILMATQGMMAGDMGFSKALVYLAGWAA